ncbi:MULTISPECIES: hypothetical protein [unclassified Microcoleus]|uniref:hypothetical protein n=1 Tax=unclassified Microcoleus TaxID=2642155 RepID=UPI002FD17623
MSDDKSAIQVAEELFQEAYKEVEAKNYSGALQLCQAALAIYQKIGDLSGVAYTLATITDICRLSLESLEPLLSESDSRPNIESRKPLSLLLEPDSGSDAEPPPPQKDTNRLRIKIEKGESDPGKPPPPSRLIIESDRAMRKAAKAGVSDPPPTPTPDIARLMTRGAEAGVEAAVTGVDDTPPTPTPDIARLMTRGAEAGVEAAVKGVPDPPPTPTPNRPPSRPSPSR